MSRALALLVLGACTRAANPSDTDTAADTDTDTTTDTATDTDTAAVDTSAPCTFAVPADARVIDADTSITDDGVVGWVCRNTTLSYAGTGGTFYLGARAEIVLAQVGGNTVYAETNADVHNFGANTLVVGDAGDVLDESDGTSTITVCPDLALDLANAPDPGC